MAQGLCLFAVGRDERSQKHWCTQAVGMSITYTAQPCQKQTAKSMPTNLCQLLEAQAPAEILSLPVHFVVERFLAAVTQRP